MEKKKDPAFRPEPPSRQQTKSRDEEQLEAMIDETVDESFPASDPPAWDALARRKSAGDKKRRKSEAA
jgi:hypothetical protein